MSDFTIPSAGDLNPETNLPSEGKQTPPVTPLTNGKSDFAIPSSDKLTNTPITPLPGFSSGAVDLSLDPKKFERLKNFRVGADHYEDRAKAQTAWDLIKNSTVQSLAVAAGATIESAGSLIDLFNPNFYKTVAEAEQDFKSNFITQFGRAIQEGSREKFPVYTTKATQEGFAPGDATWYASLAPSIFTSVGFLLPAGAVGSLIGRGARALQLSRRMQAGTRTVGAAFASRHMESTMESSRLFEETFKDMIARGYDEETARDKASDAAAFRYVSDYMNLGKDLVAWSIAFKGVNYASRSLANRSKNFAKHAPRNTHVSRMLKGEKEMPKWLAASGDLVKVGALEGLEEINQGYMTRVAEKWADTISGVSSDERPNGISFFLDSLGDGTVAEHLKDRHTWDEGIMGFMGGMIFAGASKAAMSSMNKKERARHDRVIRDIETQLQGVNQALDSHLAAEEAGDSQQAEMVLSGLFSKLNMDALNKGTLDINKELYETIAEASDEQIEKMGFGAGAQQSARFALDHANRIEKAFNSYMNMELGEFTPQIALQAAYIESDATSAENLGIKFNEQFEKEFEENGLYSSLSDSGKERARLRNREIALIRAISENEDTLERVKARKGELGPMEQIRNQAAQEYLQELKEELSQVQQERKDADTRSKEELSASKHKRETALINLTRKNRGAAQKLFRAHDIKGLAQLRQAELAHLLDPENLEAINKDMQERREAEEKAAEERAKREQEERDRTEKAEQASEERQQTDRERFLSKNESALTELGFDFSRIDDYSSSELQNAIDQGLRPENLLRMREFDEANAESYDESIEMEMSSEDALIKSRMEAAGITKEEASEETSEEEAPAPKESTSKEEQEDDNVAPATTQQSGDSIELDAEASSALIEERRRMAGLDAQEETSEETEQEAEAAEEEISLEKDAKTVLEAYERKHNKKSDMPLEGVVDRYAESMKQKPSQWFLSEDLEKVKPAVDRLYLQLLYERGAINYDPYARRKENSQPQEEAAEETQEESTEESTPKPGAQPKHPEDLQPVSAEDAKGQWFLDLNHPQANRHDAENVLIEGHPYTILSTGQIYDRLERLVTGSVREHVIEQLKKGWPELVPAEEAPERSPIEGVEVKIKLSDGTRTFIIDAHGGVFDAATGTKIENQKLINMALVRAENNPARRVKHGTMDVVVLGDDRIISVSKSNAGEELLSPKDELTAKQRSLREEIITEANGEPTPTEAAQQDEFDQSAQVGQETESESDTELLAEYPEDAEPDNHRTTQRLYWKSTNNNYGNPGGNEGATAYFEDPDAPVVGTTVEFRISLDEAALKGVPEEIAQAYRGGRPIVKEGQSYYIETAKGRRKIQQNHFPAIAGHLLNKDGSPVVAAEQEVRAFLPQPWSIKNSRSLNQRQKAEAIRQVLANRVAMYNAAINGSPMRSHIISRGSGFPSSAPRGKNGAPARNRVSTFIQNLEKEGLSFRFGLVNRESTPIDVDGEFMMEVEGQPGNFILFIEGFDDKYYPHKLNVRKINREEANFAASLIKGYLKGEIGLDDMITSEISEKVNGMTVRQFFDLLVFHGRDATNIYTKHPDKYNRSRTMFFDSSYGKRRFRLGDKVYSSENIDAEAANVARHIYTHKNHQVHAAGFGQGNKLLNILHSGSQITWFGRTIYPDKDGSYFDFLFEGAQPAVTTDVQVDKPRMVQPSIHFDPAAEPAESSKKEQTPKEEEQEAQEVAEEEQVLEEKYDDPMSGVDPIDPVRFKSGEGPKKDFNRSIRGEMEEVEKILPPGVEMNIDPELGLFAKLSGHENPSRVWGMFAYGMIYISENAPEGTAYHEAFHAVFNLSLTEPTRTAIYEEVEGKFKERYNREAENDLELEEFLADEFALFMLKEGDYSVSPAVDGFFARIWEWIKQVFSSKSKVDKLFERIESGYFAQAPRYDNSFAESLSPRFKAESPVFTPNIRNSMVRALAYNIAQRANFQTSEDVTNIDLSSIPGLIAGYYKREKGVNAKRADLWAQAIQPEALGKIQQEVEEFFYQLGIHGKNHKAFDYDMLVSGEYEDTSPTERHKERLFIPTAYEYSNWDSAGANTKLSVAMLPKLKSAERLPDGKLDYEYDEVTGDPVFLEPERAWELLLRTLSNTVTTSEATGWDQLIDGVRKAAEIEPSLNLLADRLESTYDAETGEGMPQHKKNEFFNAFGSKVEMNYRTMIYGDDHRGQRSPEEEVPFRVAIFESDLYRKGKKLVNQWKSTFRGKIFTPREEKIALNRTQVAKVVEDYKAVKQRMKDSMNLDLVPELVRVLNEVGIGVDTRTLEIFFSRQDSLQGAANYLLNLIDSIYLGKKGNSLSAMLDSDNELGMFQSDNPMSSKAVKRLAELHNEAHPELSQSTILAADAKSKWNYSEANYYFDELNRLKNDPRYLAEVEKERMKNNLVLLKVLKNPNSALHYGVIANIKSRRKFDQGRDYADSEAHEEYILKYNALLQGQAPALNFSDKKTAMVLSGIDFDPFHALLQVNKENPNSKKLTLSQDIIEQFAGYMQSEIQRVHQVQTDLQVLNDDQLTATYHYTINPDGSINKNNGRGKEFILFPELTKANLRESNKALHDMLYGESDLINAYSPQMKAELLKEAEKVLAGAVRQEIAQLKANRIIGADGTLSTNIIDASYLYKTHHKNVDEDTARKLQNYDRQFSAIANATVNGLAMNIEQLLLFHGDPAFFKSFDDLRKRTSGPAAFRRRLNTGDPQVRKSYKMAVARDVVKPSDYISSLEKELKGVVNEKRLKKILDAYKKVNTTDAQAYITLDRAVEILRGEGRWRTSDDRVLERWRKGDTEVLKTRGGRRIQQLFLTPFKGVHYGMEYTDPNSNLRSPVYLKYSQLVLLPGMVARSPELQKLEQAMQHYGVDEMVFESGVKVGARGLRDVSNFDELELVPNTLSNENWGRQVETPTKGVTEKGLDGTQVRRNILLGIRDGRTYKGNRNSQEMAFQYNSVVEAMSMRGLTGLEEDLGVEVSSVTGLARITNVDNFGRLMSKEAKSRNSAQNIMESYEVVDNAIRVALELNPRGGQAEAIMLSLYKNRAIRQDVFAGSYVQASSYGFKSYGELTPKQIKDAVIPEGELAPPRMENGEVKFAQVLAPSWFGDVIAKATGKESSELTREEIKEFFSDNPELLQFVGYRIPNQGLSSIESLEIVGFLPEDMGDTMVVYEELTAKNDSDFDVDKMYGLMPMFKIEENKPVLYRFYEDTQSKKQLRAIYNDRYGYQGQMQNLVNILSRVREKQAQGMPTDEIIAGETNVEFVDNAWIIGGRTEDKLDNIAEKLSEVPSLNDFINEHMGGDPYELNSDQALHNHRIQLMLDIMSHPEVLADSLMPITDSDLVDFAQKLSMRIGSAQMYGGVQEFLPSSQIEIGRRFRSGKNMIGTLANHFGSHAISTKTNMAIRKSGVAAGFASNTWTKKKTVFSSLSQYEDAKGRPIAEQLSTLMSGFLDATSDSWALELNLTDDTSNLAALLLRLGSGWERTLLFLNQPIIRELAMLKPMVESKIIRLNAPSAEAHLVRFYTQKIADKLGHDDIGRALEEGLIEAKSPKQLLSQANLDRNVDPSDSLQYYYDQIQMIHAFAELETVAASLSNFVSSTKFDVDMPASIVELGINEMRLQEAHESGWLEMGGYIEQSFLQGFQHVYKSASALAEGTFLGRSRLGKRLTKSVQGTSGQPFKISRDKNTLRDINNALITYAIQSQPRGQNTVNPYYRTPDQVKAMFYGDNSMARRLIRLKSHPELEDNTFIKYLNPSIEHKRPDFLETSYRERGVLFTNRLVHGWEQLLASEDPAISRFGKDLVHYAYTTSGMRRGMNTIHDLIPSEVLAEISTYFEEFKRSHGHTTENAGQITREILRNEYDNYLLVPTLYPKKIGRKAYSEKQLLGFDVPLSNLPHTRTEKANGEVEITFPQVVELGGNIYKAVTELTPDERISYGLLQKKGYHDGDYHIYEYFNPDQPSIVEGNAVESSVPFDEGFQIVEQTELFKPLPDNKEMRQFTMDKVLKNKLC